MSIVADPEDRWNTSAYHRMLSARHEIGTLLVDFEDGATVMVEARLLLPPESDEEPDWEALSTDGYEIIDPTPSGQIEIAWSSIRLQSDREFAAHWGAMVRVENRSIGARVRAWRQDRGLSEAGLARAAGLSLKLLNEAETGRVTAGFSTLEAIVTPLGHSLDDPAAGDRRASRIGSASPSMAVG